MSGVQGIGGVPGPRPERQEGVQSDSSTEAPQTSRQSDQVVISSEAAAAARIASAIQVADTSSDVREDRVAEARAALERGDFEQPEIARQVAERLDEIL